jgi:hypothetical protein
MADSEFEDLFALARSHCRAFIEELSAYGLRPSPRLELRRSRNLLSFYDPQDGHIYISFPDPADPAAKLQILILQAVLGASDAAELMNFLRIFVPYVVAHELGHHLRHEYGRAGDNAWHEEQVANHLALALTKRRLTPDQRSFARDFLARAMRVQGGETGRAVSSYASILHSLNAAGEIDHATLKRARTIQALTQAEIGQLLRASGFLSSAAARALDQRNETIAAINDEYARNMMAYMATQIGWLHLGLNSSETHYVDEFARTHLGQSAGLLPSVDDSAIADDQAVLALFRAAVDARPASESASRYFHKRYRSSLIARTCAELDTAGWGVDRASRDAGAVLEDWTDAENDPLNYLVEMVSEDLRPLFPARISRPAESTPPAVAHLPTETDRRLWSHVCRAEDDPSARATIARLDLLNRIDVFRPLPAGVWMDLARDFCRVKLAAGEVLIWEGERNDDVFTVIDGALDVIVRQGNTDRRVGDIGRGEVLGEVAFFTGEPRTATVRASVPSECLALRSADLHVLAFRHPSILMRMAGVLARRVSALNRRVIT